MKKNTDVIISLAGINKSFPMELGGQQQVLFDITFKVHAGEFVAVMGPSGSGKSTCMNIIGALDTPTSGVYELYGRDVTGLTPDELAIVRNEHIGFVFQQFNLLSKRSVLDNVMLPLMYRGMPMDERVRRARDMLKRVGLENFESYLPTQLSGGMKQRVAIARALAGDPKLILADEPTGALDSKMGNEILTFFKKLNKEMGITIVMITHEFDIAKYADRLIHIRDGRINYDGPIPKNDSKL
ncbi:MAG: ABC transporter ATP-binding protein [Alphaproteobacteria bacterium]|jgi:putative ABC transport system ATP-binding protein|nr:ABC transporter ATP-binding protein [Alphaproteobacteria bacterium]